MPDRRTYLAKIFGEMGVEEYTKHMFTIIDEIDEKYIVGYIIGNYKGSIDENIIRACLKCGYSGIAKLVKSAPLDVLQKLTPGELREIIKLS